MKTNVQNRRGFTLVELLVVIVIIASLAGLTAPMVIRQRKKADQTQAVSNARQIGLAMTEFEADYGSYPDTVTLGKIVAIFPTPPVAASAATDSNGWFKQLFHAGITESEEMFYAKAAGTTKPDGDISTSTLALATKEVGFAYFMSGTDGYTSAGNPARVLVATPMATTAAFDGGPFDRKAVTLRIDNSVSSLNIDVDPATNIGPAKIAAADVMTAPMWGTNVPTAVLPLGLTPPPAP